MPVISDVMPAATERPSGGFRQHPFGTISSIESKKPSFFGIVGSIIDASCATT